MNTKQNVVATLIIVISCALVYVVLPKIQYKPQGQAYTWVPMSEVVTPDGVKVFDHLALGWHPVGEVNVKYSVLANDPNPQAAVIAYARKLVAAKGGKGIIIQAYLTFRDVIHFRAVIVSP